MWISFPGEGSNGGWGFGTNRKKAVSQILSSDIYLLQ
jgi:hypothetical protein